MRRINGIMVNLNEISQNLQYGRVRETSALTEQAIKENYPLETIITEGFLAGLEALEERRRQKEIRFSEIALALCALNRGINRIRQEQASSPQKSLCTMTVIIGETEGDAEDTMKNIITVILEGRGFRVIDLGTCVTPGEFIRVAQKENAQLIICSAALINTIGSMKNLVQGAATAGIRGKIKIMLTGAPVTEQYCRLIGADLYAPDAVAVTELASACCKKG
jgi:methanogenic corrinoid protein MtbC1